LPNCQQVHDALQEAAHLVDTGNPAKALRAMSGIPEFGQISFASKVLAAMAPERCGVYDKVVSDALRAGGSTWSAYVTSANTGGITGPKADVYARWCGLCAARAEQMNLYGVSVSGWDYDGVNKRKWRAVDVERAFFNGRQVSLLSGPTHP
jgi:hypothetical protein